MTTLIQTQVGILRKMQSALQNPIQYTLCVGENTIPLNAYLNKELHFRFTGNIFCVQCNRKTNKSFQQGYCYPCLQRLYECDLCMLHPERCRVEQGTCKDDWAHAHCTQNHVVYLANSSALKVGITRVSQMPTRWIDQGATQALPIFQVGNRYQGAVLEVAIKKWVADKTQWQTMLKKNNEPIDLASHRDELLKKLEGVLELLVQKYDTNPFIFLKEFSPVEIHYPVFQYPSKINSLSLDKTSEIKSILLGIKGQYLILENGVINIRKFSGYQIEFLSERML